MRHLIGLGLGLRRSLLRIDAVAHNEQQGGERHRQGHRQHQLLDNVGGQDGALARNAEKHEGELATLRQRQRLHARHLGTGSHQPAQSVEAEALDRNQADGEPHDLDRVLEDHAEIDPHTDGDEEKTHQQALERGDGAFELVAEIGVGQQHAGNEGPERHRQPARLQQQCQAQGGGERGGGEHLAAVDAADMAKDDVEHRPADHHHHRQHGQPDHRRHAFIGGFRPQQRQQRQQRDHHQVLEEQDGKGLAPIAAVQFAALGQGRQHEGGGRQRQRQTGEDRLRPAQAEQARGTDQQRTDTEELQPAQADHRLAQRPQARGLQLQADDEEQQHHPELGGVEQVRGIVDHAQAPGPDQHPGGEIAEHRAEAGTLEERHQKDGHDEQRGEGCNGLHWMWIQSMSAEREAASNGPRPSVNSAAPV